MECKNCSTEFEGKFCPSCGQKAKTNRITIAQVFRDLRDQLIHFEKGFLYTIRELALRPGDMLREYLAGKRVRHIKPIRFLFWASAINILFSAYADLEGRIMASLAAAGNTELNEESRAVGHTIMEWVNSYPGVVALLTVPTIALFGWIFTRKKGYNYAENFTVSTYLMGQLSLFAIFITSIYILAPNLSITVMTVAGLFQWLVWSLYYGWTYSVLLGQKGKFAGWLKGIAILVAGYTLLILIISIVSATAVYFMKDNLLPGAAPVQ